MTFLQFVLGLGAVMTGGFLLLFFSVGLIVGEFLTVSEWVRL